MATFLRSATAVYDVGAEFNQPTINSVQCAAGDYLVAIYQYRNTSGNQTSSPTWNGETLPQIFSDYIYVDEDQFAKVSIYAKFVSSSGTFNLIGNANNYIACLCTAIVANGVNVTTPLSSLFTLNKFSMAYTNPTLAVTGVAASDVVIDILCSSFWDSGYSAYPAVTWTATQSQANISDLTTTSNQIGRQKVSRKTGTGSVSVGYSPSAQQPGYGYLAFALKNAGAVATVTPTTPVAVGGTGYSLTSSGLGAITSLTNATITGTSTNAANYNMNAWQNGVQYLAVGAGRTQVAGDGSLTANGTITLNPPTGYATVNLVNPIDTGAYSLGKDAAFVDGVQVSLPTAAGTLNVNGTLTDYTFGTYNGWMRDLDGTMYSFQLTVSEGAVLTDGHPSQHRLLTMILPSLSRR